MQYYGVIRGKYDREAQFHNKSNIGSCLCIFLFQKLATWYFIMCCVMFEVAVNKGQAAPGLVWCHVVY